jgi:hypothetical protein
MGIDLNLLCKQLQTVTQLTLLKYNAALLAAANGKTSPYVLSQAELDDIVIKQQRTKALTLSPDLATVRTTPILLDGTVTFFIDIPIIDYSKEFQIFTVNPLPIFMDNKTFLPNLDSDHIAINNHGDKFTTLTTIQLTACLDKPPRCVSNTAITPINNGISCVALSYTMDAQICPLLPSSAAPLPRFYFYDEDMFYSTPNETKVFMQCTPIPNKNGVVSTTMKLNGYGQHTLMPSCTLTMPDGTTHSTPTKPANYTSMDHPLFQQVTQEVQPTQDLVRIDNTPIFGNIANLKIALNNAPDNIVEWTDKLTDSFHPVTVMSNITQFLIVITVLSFIAALFYCCCKNRIRSCCQPRQRYTLPDAIPDFNESPDRHWFPDTNQQEPDTISDIAARPSPHRNQTAHIGPLRTIQNQVNRWTGTDQDSLQTRARAMSTDQMSREQMRSMLHNVDIQPQRPQSLNNLLDDNGRPKSIIKPTSFPVSDLDQVKAEQQRLILQHEQEKQKSRTAPHSPNSHVSFRNDTDLSSASAHISRPLSQNYQGALPRAYTHS